MSKRLSKSYNTYKEMLNPDFRQEVEAMIDQFETDFYSSIPGAADMLDPSKFNMAFYKRHTTETVLRIALKRAVDPLIANYWSTRDDDLCREWGLYGAEEGLHTKLFSKDLEKLGMTREEVSDTPPTFATELLNGYFYYTMQVEDPLASMVSGFYLETVADRTQPRWLDSIEQHLDHGMTKGQRAHLAIDETDEHAEMVWNMINRRINSQEDRDRFKQHLVKINALFTAYFVEMTMMMVGKVDPVLVTTTAVQASEKYRQPEPAMQ